MGAGGFCGYGLGVKTIEDCGHPHLLGSTQMTSITLWSLVLRPHALETFQPDSSSLWVCPSPLSRLCLPKRIPGSFGLPWPFCLEPQLVCVLCVLVLPWLLEMQLSASWDTLDNPDLDLSDLERLQTRTRGPFCCSLTLRRSSSYPRVVF